MADNKLDILNMNLNLFKTFLVVVEESSFVKAGEKLGIAQSAVTLRINWLEDNFNIQLLKRGKGKTKLRLTAAGEEFYNQCQNLCNLAENFAEEMLSLKAGSSGVLRISVSASRSYDILHNYLIPFHNILPNVNFETKEGTLPQLEKNVQSGLTELAIANSPLREPQCFEILHSMREKVYAITAQNASFFLPDKETLEIGDLANVPISLSKGSSILFLERMARSGYKPYILARNSSRVMALSWAERGMAVAVIPMDIHAQKDPKLRYISINDESLYTEKIVYKLAHKPLSNLARRFLDFYLQKVEQNMTK